MSDGIIGKYRLVVEIGKGGMADVFLAVAQGPIGFNKLLVIKRLKADMAEDPELVSMQIDEARLAARLNHPNVVQTVEVAEDRGQYYIAMEYLEGQPLNRILSRAARGRPIPLAARLRIVCDALAGLHYAHELIDFDGTPLDVVHRDATPQNIFVTYDGQVKLVDFGIAKASKREAETRIGMIKGKIPYMGPQQANGLPVDRRADIFSMGVILWETLAESRMWKNIDELVIVHRLTAGQLPKLRDVKPDVHPELERIVNRAMSIDIEGRYPTAFEFQRDLEAFIETSGERTSSRELGAFVAELFAARRAEMRRLIDSQLMELKTNALMNHKPARIYYETGGPSEPPPGELGRSSTASGMPRISLSERGLGTAVRGESTPPPELDATGMPVTSPDTGSKLTLRKATDSIDEIRSLRRKRLVSLAAVGLVAFSVGGWVAIQRRVPAESPAVAPARSAAPAAPISPPSEEKITITLKANVPNAKFSFDNDAPLENPFVGRFTKDDSQHQLRVEAPGYKPKTAQIVFSADVVLDFALERESSAAPRNVAPAQPSPLTRDPVIKPKHRIDTSDPWGK
jgi:serine/threonine protein kinase